MNWLVLLLAGMTANTPWHHQLYLSGGGYWQGRVRVVVHNDTPEELAGRSIGVKIGGGPGELDLAETPAQAIRVCNQRGVEMIFALAQADGSPLFTGPIPSGSRLAIPVECKPQSSAVYYVYFDNPTAGEAPDFLAAHAELVNGDLERGEGSVPAGWKHDVGDDRRRTRWSTEQPQSAKRCLETVVAAGAEPSWISTRQHGIQIIGRAKYVMRAWVKAEDVEGFAGWYIHVGNAKDPMIVSPMLNGGGGTYDWKEVVAEFTAADDADMADLGTVLRGTGSAWFDNASLTCLTPNKIRAVAEKPERIELHEIGEKAPWHTENSGQTRWDHRAAVKVFNFDSQPLESRLISLDLSLLEARARGRLNRNSLRVMATGKRLPHDLLFGALLFEADVPPNSVRTYYVYFCDDPQVPKATGAELSSRVLEEQNLVKNAGFETGEKRPPHWTHDPAAEGVTFSLDTPKHPELGRRCAKMHVPKDAPQIWRGWRQNVPVLPGRSYLVAGWLRSKELAGNVQLHFHLLNRAGQLCKVHPMRGAGPPLHGTTDWTWISTIVQTPDDAAAVQLHLTTDTSGTVWHDEILVAEVISGEVVALEGRPVDTADSLHVWPVGAVVKVFQDDPPPRKILPAGISLARNEKEPLQLAVRGGRALQGVQIEVEPPRGSAGASLEDVQINVVGYVPIDYPTNYYRSTARRWHRKVPTVSPGCDGWPGMWPDPLLPRHRFDLAPNRTQAIWVTVAAGKETPSGDYRGKVRLRCNEETIAEVPFEVHVWDFTLPDESHVKAIYDARLGPGREHWGDDADAVYGDVIRFLAQRRLCGDTIRPAPYIRYENGRVVADFAEFDRAAEYYFDQLKLPHAYTPWNFYLFGWGHPPATKFGQAPYPGKWPYEEADRSQLRPEFERAYQACLKTFWDHLEEKGWQEKFVLYISDEPFDRQPQIRAQMKALCRMIHEVDPAIPIYCSTWKHVPDWDGSLDVWGIGHYGVVPTAQMAKLRAAGDRLWFTTDGQMCTDTPYCAVERLLPHYCFKYGIEAYEFWGASWLTYDPYRFGYHAYIDQTDQPGKRYWVRYPNGDGFLIYPGRPIGHDGLVSSIRLEQAREGVEDYEYLYLLRSLISQAKASGRITNTETTEAEEALKRAAQLVTIPNAGGRYSSKILPDPDAVFRFKQSTAQAIESLKRSNPLNKRTRNS